MHFVLSWDIKAQGTRRTTIENSLLLGIKNFPSTRPLTTFYVVKVFSISDWNNIFRYLSSVVRRFPGEIEFIMGPPIQGGRYDGSLPPKFWPDINNKTH